MPSLTSGLLGALLLLMFAHVVVADDGPTSATKRLVLVNAVQPMYISRLIDQIISTSQHVTEVVLLHRDDVASKRAVGDVMQRHSASSSSLVLLNTYADGDVSLQSPSAAPLLTAASFIKKRVAFDGLIIYVDGLRTAWCGDPFLLADFSNADRIYKMDSCWGIPSCKVDAPGPYFFAGRDVAMRRPFSMLDETFSCSAGTIDGTRLTQFILDRYGIGWPGAVQSMPSAVSGHPNAAVCTAARSLIKASATNVTMATAVCRAAKDLATPLSLLVDYAMCTDGPNDDQFGDFCPVHYVNEVYEPPSSGNAMRHHALQTLKPAVLESLGKVNSNAEFLAAKARPKQRNADSFGSCSGGTSLPNAVIGIAGGYHVDIFSPFVDSFLATAMPNCTQLILFVSDVEKVRASRPRWAQVTLLAVASYPVLEIPSSCGWSDKRFEVYYRWLLQNVDKYFMAALVDVRDVIFQVDPFAQLVASQMWRNHFLDTAADDELFLASMEEYVASSSSSYAVAASAFFNLWHDAGIGQAYRKMLQVMVFPGTNEHFPVLCSGLFLGTAKALLHVTFSMISSYKGIPCGFDQGVFQMLAVDGLAAAGYRGKIRYFNPHYSTMRNGAERPQDVLWKDGKLVNCYGEPYSIIHQFEQGRHPWAGGRIINEVVRSK